MGALDQLYADLLADTDDGAHVVIVTLRVTSDPCGCRQVVARHAALLTDPVDQGVARTLLRRQYDRVAGRPMATLATELDIGVATFPNGDQL